MSEDRDQFNDEEPATTIATKVQRAVDRQELRQKRRFWDKFVLPGVFTGAFLLVAWLLWLRDVTNSHGIYIAQLQASISSITTDINELKKEMNARAETKGVGIDKIIALSTELSIIDRRVTALERKSELMPPPTEDKQTRRQR